MQRTVVIRVMIVLAVLLAFGPLCFSEFSWYDDPATVHHNPALNPPTLAKVARYWTQFGSDAPMGLYIPLTYSAWGALAKLAYVNQPDDFGIHLNPWPFHSANVICHMLAALVVFEILRLLVKQDWPAAAGALLFALHPVQVEAVGWVSGMKDVLCGLLSLVAIWQYLLGSRFRHALATLAFITAMLAKPTAMVVPLIVLCIDVVVVGREMRRALLSMIPWLVLAVPCMFWTRAAQPASDVLAAPIWARPILALDSIGFYIGKLILPIGLVVDYGRTPLRALNSQAIYFTWIVPVTIGVVLVLNRRRAPMLLVAGAILVIGVLPVLGFAPFLFQHFSGVADHYLYLSMLGPALAVAALVARLNGRPILLAAATALVLLGALTFRQSRFWHDDITLFSHNLSVNPRSGLAHLNLGAALKAAHDMDAAERHYREALRIDPTDTFARDNLAELLRERGR